MGCISSFSFSFSFFSFSLFTDHYCNQQSLMILFWSWLAVLLFAVYFSKWKQYIWPCNIVTSEQPPNNYLLDNPQRKFQYGLSNQILQGCSISYRLLSIWIQKELYSIYNLNDNLCLKQIQAFLYFENCLYSIRWCNHHI